jgi:hypothetical protein
MADEPEVEDMEPEPEEEEEPEPEPEPKKPKIKEDDPSTWSGASTARVSVVVFPCRRARRRGAPQSLAAP